MTIDIFLLGLIVISFLIGKRQLKILEKTLFEKAEAKIKAAVNKHEEELMKYLKSTVAVPQKTSSPSRAKASPPPAKKSRSSKGSGK